MAPRGWTLLAAGVAGWLSGGCAARAVRPDDMSAAAHRQEASKEYAAADAHRRQYDSRAVAENRDVSHNDPMGGATTIAYNPTEWHLREADRRTRHAHEHEAAAAALENFESAECGAYSRKVRAACPVTGPIARIELVDGGVRLIPASRDLIQALVGHMRCHLAWARTRGYEQSAECPLYIKGIEIEASADGRAIDLVSRDARVTVEIRRRALALPVDQVR